MRNRQKSILLRPTYQRPKLLFMISYFLVAAFLFPTTSNIRYASTSDETLGSIQPYPIAQNIILAPESARAATSINAQVGCMGETHSKGFVKLTWKTAANIGVGQRVDITIFRGGFEHQNFESSELLPADQNSFIWDRLRGQAIHFVRILTKQKDGWVPSEIISFEGPLCIMDSRRKCVKPSS